MTRPLAFALLLALLAPATLALPGQPPANDVVDAGWMICDQDADGRFRGGGFANNDLLPRLRTTDNGHVQLVATGAAVQGVRCEFAVVVTGFVLMGFMPSGSLTNVVNAPCFAGSLCNATADADWKVNFVAPPSVTIGMDIHFDLRVAGMTVDSGIVRIADPSVPDVVTLP